MSISFSLIFILGWLRRSWAKFGDAINDGPSGRLTMVSTEEIFIERQCAPGASQEVEPVTVGDSLEPKAGGALMMCGKCNKKGDNWTARCSYNVGVSVDDDKLPATNSASTSATSDKYVPPRARPAALAISAKRSYSGTLEQSAGPMLRVTRSLDRAGGSASSISSTRRMLREILTSSMVMGALARRYIKIPVFEREIYIKSQCV